VCQGPGIGGHGVDGRDYHRPKMPLESPIPFLAGVSLVLMGGCAHQHQVGRSPSTDEIVEINRAGGGQPMAVYYVDPLASCAGGTCSVSGATSASNGPPPEIERIVSADSRQLTVVTASGERWTLPTAQVAGVTARGHGTLAGFFVGAPLGLLLGTPIAVLFSGPGPDVNVPPSQSGGGSSTGRVAGILVGFTVVGAIIGAIVGYNTFTFDTYQLGDASQSVGPATFRR